MKIQGCTLMGFGKFHRKTIAFGDGLHVIYGENEAGKTTLKAYLVAMLFGIEKKRGLASKNDDYHRYLPYMGGIYGGTLDFVYQGRNYQVQRNFSQNQDVILFDRDTGRRISERRELSGTLFSMTREGFLQTLCVSQGEILTGRELTFMLRNYLANMSRTRTRDVNVEEALSYLRKEIRREKKSEAYQLRDRLKEEIEDGKDGEKRIVALEEKKQKYYDLLGQEEELGLFQRIMAWIRRFLGFASQEELDRQEYTYQIEMIDMKLEQLYANQKRRLKQRRHMEELKNQIHETEVNIRAMERAMNAISEASEEIHEAFGNGLEERVSTIMEEITDGTYAKIRIDDSMGIVVEKDGTLLDINYLSTGTVEQIYLAVRIAAAELMFQEEQFPIILDDVFGNFDDQRLRRILTFLGEEKRQVLVFTCRKDVLHILDESGCRYEKTVLV